jgi:hypothetical protein
VKHYIVVMWSWANRNNADPRAAEFSIISKDEGDSFKKHLRTPEERAEFEEWLREKDAGLPLPQHSSETEIESKD